MKLTTHIGTGFEYQGRVIDINADPTQRAAEQQIVRIDNVATAEYLIKQLQIYIQFKLEDNLCNLN